MSAFWRSRSFASGSTSCAQNCCATSWIRSRSGVRYGLAAVIAATPLSCKVRPLVVDDQLVALVEPLGVPGDDTEARARLRFPCRHHRAARRQGVAGVDRTVERQLIDTQERPARFAEVLDAQPDDRTQHQERAHDNAPGAG